MMHKKLTLRTINKNKNSIKKVKVVKLTSKQAKIRQNLGNGFTRLVFGPFTIDRFQTRLIRFEGSERNVHPVSGGWWFQYHQTGPEGELVPGFATSSYPQNDRDWVIVLRNSSRLIRQFRVLFIVKNQE
ncbi:hypothetical protein [Robertmurraya sp.]|uniref:hypothetical protein n=1 Tax=Robertmurraya sp. TaxID=2837525 RepID=UPI0037049C73